MGDIEADGIAIGIPTNQDTRTAAYVVQGIVLDGVLVSVILQLDGIVGYIVDGVVGERIQGAVQPQVYTDNTDIMD
jgi:hypothetical protein